MLMSMLLILRTLTGCLWSGSGGGGAAERKREGLEGGRGGVGMDNEYT